MKYKDILEQLPYQKPFLFVDSLEKVDEDGAEGNFTFRSDQPFYQGHFKDNPITPGVLLTECCAQIGLVCLGIYLIRSLDTTGKAFALSSSEMQFFIPVYPGETVKVRSQLHYFRFNKLKCGVRMYNARNVVVCKGILAGMLIPEDHE